MSKKRLLVLSSTYPRWAGDTEPGFVHELSRRLAAEFDVCVICPHAPGAAEEEVLDGVRIVRYRYAPAAFETLVNDGGIVNNLKSRPWKWLLVPPFLGALLVRVWREIRLWRPDVVHAHWLIPQGMAMAVCSSLGRAPAFLLTAHGADVFALRGSLANRLKRFALVRSRAVTVVSHAMREELLDLGVEPGKVDVLPMGVDLRDRFTVDEAVPRSVAEILFVGRFVEKKGLKHVLQAMPSILARFPDARLTVVGFGPEDMLYREMVRSLEISAQVDFVGAVDQAGLPAYYRRATVLVAPFVQASSGDKDGLGLVLVEALGCGCRVVVSDLPAARDVVEGLPGVTTVATNALQQLDRVLTDVLLQDPLPLAQQHTAAELLRSRFDWAVIAGSYAKILRKLVDHSAPAT